MGGRRKETWLAIFNFTFFYIFVIIFWRDCSTLSAFDYWILKEKGFLRRIHFCYLVFIWENRIFFFLSLFWGESICWFLDGQTDRLATCGWVLLSTPGGFLFLVTSLTAIGLLIKTTIFIYLVIACKNLWSLVFLKSAPIPKWCLVWSRFFEGCTKKRIDAYEIIIIIIDIKW